MVCLVSCASLSYTLKCKDIMNDVCRRVGLLALSLAFVVAKPSRNVVFRINNEQGLPDNFLTVSFSSDLFQKFLDCLSQPEFTSCQVFYDIEDSLYASVTNVNGTEDSSTNHSPSRYFACDTRNPSKPPLKCERQELAGSMSDNASFQSYCTLTPKWNETRIVLVCSTTSLGILLNDTQLDVQDCGANCTCMEIQSSTSSDDNDAPVGVIIGVVIAIFIIVIIIAVVVILWRLKRLPVCPLHKIGGVRSALHNGGSQHIMTNTAPTHLRSESNEYSNDDLHSSDVHRDKEKVKPLVAPKPKNITVPVMVGSKKDVTNTEAAVADDGYSLTNSVPSASEVLKKGVRYAISGQDSRHRALVAHSNSNVTKVTAEKPEHSERCEDIKQDIEGLSVPNNDYSMAKRVSNATDALAIVEPCATSKESEHDYAIVEFTQKRDSYDEEDTGHRAHTEVSTDNGDYGHKDDGHSLAGWSSITNNVLAEGESCSDLKKDDYNYATVRVMHEKDISDKENSILRETSGRKTCNNADGHYDNPYSLAKPVTIISCAASESEMSVASEQDDQGYTCAIPSGNRYDMAKDLKLENSEGDSDSSNENYDDEKHVYEGVGNAVDVPNNTTVTKHRYPNKNPYEQISPNINSRKTFVLTQGKVSLDPNDQYSMDDNENVSAREAEHIYSKLHDKTKKITNPYSSLLLVKEDPKNPKCLPDPSHSKSTNQPSHYFLNCPIIDNSAKVKDDEGIEVIDVARYVSPRENTHSNDVNTELCGSFRQANEGKNSPTQTDKVSDTADLPPMISANEITMSEDDDKHIYFELEKECEESDENCGRAGVISLIRWWNDVDTETGGLKQQREKTPSH